MFTSSGCEINDNIMNCLQILYIALYSRKYSVVNCEVGIMVISICCNIISIEPVNVIIMSMRQNGPIYNTLL